MKLLIIPGSLRKDSFNKKVAFHAEKIAKTVGFSTTLIDLKDFSIPLLDQDDSDFQPFPQDVLKMQKLMQEHDAFLFITPEYNASVPGVLKNLIDWTSRSSTKTEPNGFYYNGKIAALMSASPSIFGGMRALLHLRQILTILQTIVIPQEKTIPEAHKVFATDEGINQHLAGMEKTIKALFTATEKLKKT
jgi:NAD(P)H-dependent FMN reductase